MDITIAKSDQSTTLYHVVRHGRNVNNCIFVSWEDAKNQVEDFDGAEYSSFDCINNALEYLGQREEPTTNHELEDMNANLNVSSIHHAESENVSPSNNFVETAFSTSNTNSVIAAVDDSIGQDINFEIQRDSGCVNGGADVGMIQGIDYHYVNDKNSNFNEQIELDENELDGDEEEEDDDNLPISLLKTSSSATNSSRSSKYLGKRKDYVAKDDNTLSSENTTKRITLPRETETIEVDGRTVFKRRPSKNWMAMYRKLQEYRNRTGSLYVDVNDEEYSALKRWISEQKHQYKCYKTGRNHFSSQIKRQLLTNIGFDFEFHVFDEKIEQLKQYKEEHGMDADVPYNHPELGSWMEAQRRQLFFYNKGKESKLSHEQVQALKDLGVDVLKVSKPNVRPRQETSAYVKKWDEMFEKIKDYKKANGNCQVSKSDLDNQELYKWVCQQRLEYKKLKNEQGNKMTASRLQKLNDLGFNFNPRSAYTRWEDRIKQLKMFKEKHGHLRVPVADPDIGEFVARQRVEYARLMDGKSCTITQERVNDLAELGFVFQVGKRRATEVKGVKKTWDERFAELLEYKEINGHCLVPQSCSLGEWVHKQRKMYKLLKSGKSCALTTERALKLADVGFVFDASGYRRGRKVVEESISVIPLPIAQMPSIPDPYDHIANINMNVNMNNM